jgi:hypothetical protein
MANPFEKLVGKLKSLASSDPPSDSHSHSHGGSPPPECLQYPVDADGAELRNYRITGPKRCVTFTPLEIGNRHRLTSDGV